MTNTYRNCLALSAVMFVAVIIWQVADGYKVSNKAFDNDLDALLDQSVLAQKNFVTDRVQRLADIGYWLTDDKTLSQYRQHCQDSNVETCLNSPITSEELFDHLQRELTVNCGQYDLLTQVTADARSGHLADKNYKIGPTKWMSTQENMAPIAHRLSGSDRWVSACFSMDAIRDFWRDLNLPNGSSMALVRKTDYTLWIREPFKPELLGRDLSDGPLVAGMIAAEPAQSGRKDIIATKTDFVARTVKWKPIGVDDLSLVAGYPKDHFYQSWLEREASHLGVLVLFIAGILVLSWGAWIALRQKIVESQSYLKQVKNSETELGVVGERLALATKAGRIGVWDLDLKAGLLTWDDLMFDLYGLKKDDFSNAYEAWSAALHPDDAERAQQSFDDAVAGRKPFDLEFRICQPNGDVKTIRAAAVVLRDATGTPMRMIGSNQDVTNEKLFAQNLEDAKIAAEAANIAKTQFLSSMSHELRTPLNAVLGFSQILESNERFPLVGDQIAAVGHIKKGGEYLLELINQVLEFAKIEEGRMTLEIKAFDAIPVIASCHSLIDNMGTKRGIMFDDQMPSNQRLMISGDVTRFKQVLLNLLTNAVKYNRDKGKVNLSMEKRPGPKIRFIVKDTGQGITDADRDAVFVPFSRLGNEAGTIEGTGLGLAISLDLVQKMQGEMGFDSTPGEGSVFWFELPLIDEEQPVHAGNNTESSKPDDQDEPGEALHKRQKVLYVEDDPASVALMEILVGRITNADLVSTHSAEIALEMAELERPSLILMDINLPGMSGIEAVGKLKQNPTTRDITVVAVSADAIEAEIQHGIEAGFDQYLTKPIKTMHVTTLIEAVLARIE